MAVRERDTPTVDASKLSFPLQVVIIILGGFAAMWASTYTLRSDVRDILTSQQYEAKISAERAKSQEERMANQREDINEMKRRLELIQLQYQAMKEQMLQMQPPRR